MSKKIVIPVVAALVLTLVAGLAVSRDVLAQGPGPLGRLARLRPVLGQVTAIGKSEFTIQTKDGTEQTFTVDGRTRYRSKDKAGLAFADLKTGQWVAVVTGRLPGARDLARLVVTMPEGLDPAQFEGVRGKVVDVKPAANQFTLEDQQGQKTVVTVGADTVYRGQVTGLADLQQGMIAGVISKEMAGDGLVARLVRAGEPVGVHAGEVTNVNTAAGTFTLKTLSANQQLTLTVDDSTRFRSKADEVSGLKDLKTGMFAIVVSKNPAGEQANAPLTAVMVAASDKSDLPQADLWVGGRLVSQARNTFTVENREGQQYTFQTTGRTRLRSRELRSLADLKIGMLVLVGAKDLGNGSYQAQVVLVLPRR
jgi:Domain of unknown function (DUF5666)